MPEHSNMQKTKNVWYKKVLFVVFILAAIFIVLDIIGQSPWIRAGYNFLFPSKAVVNSHAGRVNILIMGKAGGSHDGPDLTDTMILVSIGISKPSITLVSIPRDLWIPEIQAKINSAYYWGKNGSPYFDVSEMGGGISFAEIVAGEVVGQPIQYGAVIDFSSFKDVIDALGGIQVSVENSFTDKLYPIAGKENDTCGGDPTFACRYMAVSFSAGLQKMDGDTALEFVRSRHAEGIEGTDPAREARQQKVIDAIKNRISDPGVFLSPRVDLAMIAIVKKYIETDINLPTAGVLAREILNGRKNIYQYLILQDLLISPAAGGNYDNQYVLIPKAGDGRWEDINNWFAQILE